MRKGACMVQISHGHQRRQHSSQAEEGEGTAKGVSAVRHQNMVSNSSLHMLFSGSTFLVAPFSTGKSWPDKVN